MSNHTSLQLLYSAENQWGSDHCNDTFNKTAIEAATQKRRHWKPKLLPTVNALTQRQT
jgi:hypothetical protein